jgi:hypothetical protein
MTDNIVRELEYLFSTETGILPKELSTTLHHRIICPLLNEMCVPFSSSVQSFPSSIVPVTIKQDKAFSLFSPVLEFHGKLLGRNVCSFASG